MARHSEHPELEVRVSFEVARIAPQCLIEAYERVVPIPRRPARRMERHGAASGLSATATRPPMRRRGEHG